MSYPVFGYQITLADDAAVEVTIDGTTEDVTVSAGTYWGWPADGWWPMNCTSRRWLWIPTGVAAAMEVCF